MRQALQKIAAKFGATFDARDRMVFGGIAIAGFGIWQLHWPSALIAVGVTFTWIGLRR